MDGKKVKGRVLGEKVQISEELKVLGQPKEGFHTEPVEGNFLGVETLRALNKQKGGKEIYKLPSKTNRNK